MSTLAAVIGGMILRPALLITRPEGAGFLAGKGLLTRALAGMRESIMESLTIAQASPLIAFCALIASIRKQIRKTTYSIEFSEHYARQFQTRTTTFDLM